VTPKGQGRDPKYLSFHISITLQDKFFVYLRPTMSRDPCHHMGHILMSYFKAEVAVGDHQWL